MYRRVKKILLEHFVGKVPSRLYAITDGGGDRQVDYLSVQKRYIALFLLLGLDEHIACHTAAGQSYRNPVERMHAIVNKGLQSVGMMREKMDSNMEKLKKMQALTVK